MQYHSIIVLAIDSWLLIGISHLKVLTPTSTPDDACMTCQKLSQGTLISES
jgi:hypothetical protein